MRQLARAAVAAVALWLVACSDGANGPSGPPSAGASGVAGEPTAGGAGLSRAGAGGASAGGSTGGASGSAPQPAGTGGGAGSEGSAGSAGASVDPGPIRHRVMALEYPGKLIEISADGAKVWEHQTPSLTVMFSVLANGHVFYPHGGTARGAEEIDREHHVVWSYASPAGELLGGERLANGNTLLGEGGPAKALELDTAKTVVRSISVPTSEASAHGQIRHLHRLANGNVLAALEGEGVAREVDPSGKTVWEYGGVKSIHEAIRLPNGNTLIGGGESKRVLEVTSGGQIVWEFDATDAPELGIAFVTSIQVLKNGDLLVGNWLGAGGGVGAHAFQVTRAKKVVWKLEDHQLLKSATTVTALDD